MFVTHVNYVNRVEDNCADYTEESKCDDQAINKEINANTMGFVF